MKTMKNKIFVVLITTVFALPVMAQFEYNEPNAQFQSTSGLKTSGSTYTSTPALNADGTATYNELTAPSESSEGSMPKVRKGSVPVTPGDSGVQQPIGDAALPLMLFAAAAAATVAIRNRRRQVAE